jgi:DNA mismatch endonuclease, patch repair protein
MADTLSKEKRSWLMSRVKGKNTVPERMVFRYLRNEGVYFRRHYRAVAGSPDIAVPNKKIAVFINGDFWHGRRYKETYRKLPTFWRKKIATNIDRDRRNCRKLRASGWKVLNVWVGDLKKRPDSTLLRIQVFCTADVEKNLMKRMLKANADKYHGKSVRRGTSGGSSRARRSR